MTRCVSFCQVSHFDLLVGLVANLMFFFSFSDDCGSHWRSAAIQSLFRCWWCKPSELYNVEKAVSVSSIFLEAEESASGSLFVLVRSMVESVLDVECSGLCISISAESGPFVVADVPLSDALGSQVERLSLVFLLS